MPWKMFERLERAYPPFTGTEGVQATQTLDQTSRNSTESMSALRTEEHQVVYRWSEKRAKAIEDDGESLRESTTELGHEVEQKSSSRQIWLGRFQRLFNYPETDENTSTKETEHPNIGQRNPITLDPKKQRIQRDISTKWLVVRQLWLWKLDSSKPPAPI